MTMLATALVAAVTIAFPKEGLRIPPVSRCYVIGATDAGVSNVIVRDNVIEDVLARKVERPYRSQFYLAHVRDAKIVNNVFIKNNDDAF